MLHQVLSSHGRKGYRPLHVSELPAGVVSHCFAQKPCVVICEQTSCVACAVSRCKPYMLRLVPFAFRTCCSCRSYFWVGNKTEEEGCTMRQRIGAARAGQRGVVVVVGLYTYIERERVGMTTFAPAGLGCCRHLTASRPLTFRSHVGSSACLSVSVRAWNLTL